MWLPLEDLRHFQLAKEFAVDLSSVTLELHGDVYHSIDPTHIIFTLVGVADKIEISGAIKGRFSLGCARCLTPTEFLLQSEFSDVWWPFEAGAESDDFSVSSFVDSARQAVNLEEYATEMVLTHLPLRVWCKPDCKGICESCGENLNEDECSCAKHSVDPRFAVLGRLLNDKGGVLDGSTKEKNLKGSPR